MRKKITTRAVKALRAQDRRYVVYDTELTGFACKVEPSGTKIYIFEYRMPGRGRSANQKRIRIGAHGEVTADEAREIAANYLLELRAGKDPAAERRSEGHTVKELAEHFLTVYLPSKKRAPRQSTIDGYESIFRKHVVPRIGSRRVDDISMADVERIHIAMRNMPYIANRTLSCLQQAFDHAERIGWRARNTNPATYIDKYVEKPRGAKKAVMLDAEQMSRLLQAIDTEEAKGVDPQACNVVRLLFWTGWRLGEVLGLEWANLDLDAGVARLVRTKTADEEHRQLPMQAIDILRTIEPLAGCPYVFPGRSGQGHLTTIKRPWLRIRKRAGLDDLEGLGALRLHDLRHNVVSWDVSRGVPLEIAGKNVGHRSRRSTEVYAHFAPDALKRAVDARAGAMQQVVQDVFEERRLFEGKLKTDL